jgi:hypothetical protein
LKNLSIAFKEPVFYLVNFFDTLEPMERHNYTTKSVDYNNKICSFCLMVCYRKYKQEMDLSLLSEKEKLRELTRPCATCKCEENQHQCGSYEFVPIFSVQKFAQTANSNSNNAQNQTKEAKNGTQKPNLKIDTKNPMIGTFCALLTQHLVKIANNNQLLNK